jgi:uncharacterized protein
MRRSEKEIANREEISAILREAEVIRLAMVDCDRPYLVPVLYGFDGEHLYFHSACEGRKIDILRKNPHVCFECEVDVSLKPSDSICRWSVHYQSVIGCGKVVFLDDPVEKREAMDILLLHYAQPPFQISSSALETVCMLRLDIETMSGKRSS